MNVTHASYPGRTFRIIHLSSEDSIRSSTVIGMAILLDVESNKIATAYTYQLTVVPEKPIDDDVFGASSYDEGARAMHSEAEQAILRFAANLGVTNISASSAAHYADSLVPLLKEIEEGVEKLRRKECFDIWCEARALLSGLPIHESAQKMTKYIEASCAHKFTPYPMIGGSFKKCEICGREEDA